MGGEERSQRHAAPVHEGEWLDEQDRLARQLRGRHQASSLLAARRCAGALGESVDDHVADVVPGAAVALARVAQAHHEPHPASATSFPSSRPSRLSRPSPASRLLSPASPSATALPFLMTSGSAASAAAAAASAAGATSSSARGTTTCAITTSGTVRILTLAGSFSSETRKCLPSSRWETSIVIFSGMSAGRHSTSSSRVTKSRTPALGLDAHGHARELDVDLDLERLVEGDLVEVRVQDPALQGLPLVLLQDHLRRWPPRSRSKRVFAPAALFRMVPISRGRDGDGIVSFLVP